MNLILTFILIGCFVGVYSLIEKLYYKATGKERKIYRYPERIN